MGNGMKTLMTMITIHRSSIQKCVYLLFSQLFVLISYMYFYRLDSWLVKLVFDGAPQLFKKY